MRQPVLLEILWLTAAVAQGLWALRISQLRLVGSRPFLFAYLLSTLAIVASSFLIRWSPVDQSAYRTFWSWTQPLFWTLTLLVLVETYNHVLGRLRGFYTVGQLFLRVASATVGAVYLWMILSGSPDSWFDFWRAHRWGLFVAAALFFFLIAAFSKVNRIPLCANDRFIIVAFGLLVGSSAIGLTLTRTWDDRVDQVASVISPLIDLLTFGLAAVLFSREGEIVDLPEPLLPVSETEVLGSLDAMNRTLGKTLRK